MGPPYIGKRSFIARYTSRSSFPSPRDTIPPTFQRVHVPRLGVTVECWHTAGQERFCFLPPLYYRDAAIVLFAFDLSEPDVDGTSFPKLLRWWDEAHEHAPNLGAFPAEVIVGLKADLVDNGTAKDRMDRIRNALEQELCHVRCQRRNLEEVGCFNTSAKNGLNVAECIEYAAEAAVNGSQARTHKGSVRLPTDLAIARKHNPVDSASRCWC